MCLQTTQHGVSDSLDDVQKLMPAPIPIALDPERPEYHRALVSVDYDKQGGNYLTKNY